MPDAEPIEIKATREFQRKVRSLAKKYRHIQSDLQPVLEKLRAGEILGNRLSGVKYIVYKLRVRNRDVQKGKSGGYRIIYWLQTASGIVLLDIYSKSEQDDINVATIQRIITNFESP